MIGAKIVPVESVVDEEEAPEERERQYKAEIARLVVDRTAEKRDGCDGFRYRYDREQAGKRTL